MGKHYLTGLEALNYHGTDWHSFAFDFNREYPELIRKWCGDYGIEEKDGREIANPVRAFLDYLLYKIKFEKKVPLKRIRDLAFSEEEEREIEKLVEKKLKPFLKGKDREILEKWIKYNSGGEYEFTDIRLLKRKAWRERRRKNKYKVIRSLEPIQKNPKIYDINDLFSQKLSAFSDRKTARDLYDIAFIVNTYYSDLDYGIKQKFFSLLKSEENILDLIPEYEEVFKEDNILGLTDLLESVKRLVNFYKKMEIDLQQRKNNTKNNRKPK